MSEQETADSIIHNPWGFACQWYNEDAIKRSIDRQLSPRNDVDWIPRDVESPEFAKWLTNEYRLAMTKGARLAVSEMKQSSATRLSPSPPPSVRIGNGRRLSD